MSPESEEMSVKVGGDSSGRSVSWIPGFLLQSEKGRSNSEARKPGKRHRVVDALFLDFRLLNFPGSGRSESGIGGDERESRERFVGEVCFLDSGFPASTREGSEKFGSQEAGKKAPACRCLVLGFPASEFFRSGRAAKMVGAGFSSGFCWVGSCGEVG